MLKHKAVFLDRDGVINKDSDDYIKNWEEFEFLPGSLEALNHLARAKCKVIVITNQSIVNRALAPLEQLQRIHRKMRETIERTGGYIEDIFFCPHRPDEKCSCRKPKPGLIEQACRVHHIDPADAVMVGDNAKDIQCGQSAGCAYTVLVETGNGQSAKKELASKGIRPSVVVADLLHASELILNEKLVRSN
ncbi:MAG: D-glycero-beta-D-manno-heptose 1,7-bisphosphate 7-phosphatase [Desulfobacteraceae bacterium]|nr:D-glycero-beta-D-manno-heptose 1,7-bisphosphate 7-phosphatase [Desulfobacteraceae bacterium]